MNFRKRDSLFETMGHSSLPLAAVLASAWVRLSRSALVPVDFLRAGARINKSSSALSKQEAVRGRGWGGDSVPPTPSVKHLAEGSGKATYTESVAPVFFLK